MSTELARMSSKGSNEVAGDITMSQKNLQFIEHNLDKQKTSVEKLKHETNKVQKSLTKLCNYLKVKMINLLFFVTSVYKTLKLLNGIMIIQQWFKMTWSLISSILLNLSNLYKKRETY